MTDPVQIALLAVFILLCKHLVFDFFLQTAYQYQNKGIYGHPGGILHAGLHALGTTPVFLLITPSKGLAAVIVIGEFIVHYHIDWAKEQIVKRMQLTPERPGFWWALGVDQFLHGTTYVVIVALLMAARAG
ncbi:MAG TPA: DUF3307 domain-containing protein [Xanthobacteraceae bacterium]|nr:DUF3307 domain-containing protein [Xanthobacteraceae bacterium]